MNENIKDWYEIDLPVTKYPHSRKKIVIEKFSDDFKKRYPLLTFTTEPCLHMYSSDIIDNKLMITQHAIECKSIRTNIKFSSDVIVGIVEKNENQHFPIFLVFDAIYNYCIQNNYVCLLSMEFYYGYSDDVYELILRVGQVDNHICIIKNGIPRLMKLDDAKILKMKEILEEDNNGQII